MKVHISADMEGTTGVVDWVQVMPPWLDGKGPAEYERARQRMTREVAAAVRGALAAGADEVIVNDSHDGMKNILIDDLPRGCRLISGSQKDLSMMQGVGAEGVVATIFTGYHARAGTPNGVLAHTYIGAVADVRVDGVSMGEYGLNAAVAGDFGVPVVMVTGDDLSIEQVRDLIGAGVVGVQVKTALATETADSIHPDLACELIEAAAREAVGLRGSIQPFRVRDAFVEVDFDHQTLADLAGLGPDIQRIGERSVAFNAENGVQLMLTWRGMLSRVLTRFAL
ncbi:MAG TPA: M55 family metallopeptidase [Thermomicrobiales bacterium]|nr:M55 family metallopeptidase [Thermomicrobiales bacterium]